MRVFRNSMIILVALLILAWTVWPIVSVAVAGSIAAAHGCQVDEGSIHPCIVNGRDIGEQLYTMGVMGWFMLVTVPTGGVALLVFGAILLIVWLSRRKRRQGGIGDPVKTTA